ncbi:MAG: zinc-binding dehydrogenase [Acidobacteriota bacterium]|jgi:L-iditol 2-dehydrogenase|nr:zinc-binding dehydrogenase [Acidobacteriota bacterium]
MRELMKTDGRDKMTAAVLYGKKDVRIEQVSVPRAGKGEVLVRVKAAMTCGTDLKVYRQGFHARMIVPPSLFGHELAGVVEAVGEGVTGFTPGMRVVAANSAPCGECFFCLRGQANLCEGLQFINGAYAEFINIPERIVRKNLLAIPDGVGFEEAALMEPLACVLKGVELTGVKEGDSVALIGLGPIGLMFVQTLKSHGARVIALDKEPHKLDVARSMGADFALDSTHSSAVEQVRKLTDGSRGTDVVIEAVGVKETWQQAMHMVRKGGVINLFGGCPSGTQIPLDSTLLHYSEITVKASFHHTPRHIREALDAIASGRFDAKKLITGRERLTSLVSVLERLDNRLNGDIKVAIIP